MGLALKPIYSGFCAGCTIERGYVYTVCAASQHTKRQVARGAYTGNVCTDIVCWEFYIKKLPDTIHVSSRLLETVQKTNKTCSVSLLISLYPSWIQSPTVDHLWAKPTSTLQDQIIHSSTSHYMVKINMLVLFPVFLGRRTA